MMTERLTSGKIEKIRQTANKQINQIAEKLQLRLADRGTNLQGCCPIQHNSRTPNDNPNAFSWNYDLGIWSCFTNHCEKVYGSDIFGLIRSLKKFDTRSGFHDAVNFVCQLLGMDVEKVEPLTTGEMSSLRAYIQRRKTIHRHERLEEDILKHLCPHDYLTKRGFSTETIAAFRAGYWFKKGTIGHHRIILPIYDHEDEYFIGFTGRSLADLEKFKMIPKWFHGINFAAEWVIDPDTGKKKKPEGQSLHAGSILFNMHVAKKHMGKPKTIILVEGPLDVMRMFEAGFCNTVGLMGTAFTEQKRQILRNLGVERLVIAFDNDDAGNKCARAAEKHGGKYFNVERVIMPYGQDPGDMTTNELRRLFGKYISESL